MKILLRGILKFIRGLWENIVWGIVSLDVKAHKCGIKRRHIMFGLLALLISVLSTGLYIAQKNWFIEGKRKAGRSEQQLTISLNGEDSAVQEMSEEIRDSILETPMAAASASQAAAQSASNMNAARSNPDSASSQSSSASGAQSPAATASAAGSNSSFSPSVSTPNSSVMSGQARAENSQSMTQASAHSTAPSTSTMSAARSNPQSSAAQSAAAQSAASPSSPAASGASSALAPSVSQAANSTVQSGQPRAESSQTMSAASAQSMAQSASGMNAARSVPSSASAQSAAANSSASPTTVSAAGANSALSPSSPRAATSTVMTQRSAQSTPGQSMAQASAQSMAQSATGSSSSTRSTPSASSSASNAFAASANTSGAVSAANSSSAFSPQVSSARASSASVRSSQARAESRLDMSNASSQSLAQAATGSRGTARNSPSQSMARASGTARAANTASTASAVSGSIASFSPSVSGASASTSGVASNGARAEAGRNMSGASGQSMAQAATGSRGTARNGPSQTTGQGTGSAQASNTASSVSGLGAGRSFSPSASGVSGIGSALGGVNNSGARAEVGRGMAGASGQSMARSGIGGRGSARSGPSSTYGRGAAPGSARGMNQVAGISGTGSSRAFAPSISGSRGSSRVVMNRPALSGIEGHTHGTAPSAASGGGLTLGGGPINTDQVMAQARASSVSQPIRFTGARRHPLRAYASRPNESQPSAAPVSVAMTGNPGGRGSFSPTITRTPQTIPTFEKVQPNPESALVANNPSEELSELPPLANPYELRLSPKLRADFVKRQGGGPETEAAVALALEWLRRNQGKDGRWNHRSGHTTAATGAAMLSFLGWGAKHTEPGPYQQTLARAIDWMLSVEKNGDLRYRGNMYDHGIAAIALMEAYNLTKDERLRAPAERVLAFTLKAQNPQSGGWRYKPHREDPSEKGDLSVSGWQMMILKSARLGGMKVPEDSFAKARKFLDGVAVDGKGFQYRPGWTPSSAMIAEGLFCEQMLGAGVTTPKMEQCLNLIQKQLPSKNRVDYYYWYYGSLAMRQAQGQDWQSWNNKLKPILLRKQILRGNNRGAWEPEGKNSKAAGRVVTTALAALSLEVYYRYLPLYSPEFSKAGN